MTSIRILDNVIHTSFGAVAKYCLLISQDNYLEEAMKIRNLLEEFDEKYWNSHSLRAPTILGVREHVFTGRFFRSLGLLSIFCI